MNLFSISGRVIRYPSISPNYDTDSEEENEAIEENSTDSSLSELSNNRSDSIDFSFDETAHQSDEDSIMSRRSARLSGGSSVNSSQSSNSAGPSHRSFTPELNNSNDTVDYELDNMSDDGIIEINDTQLMGSPQGAMALSENDDEDDEDVIHIPQYIETIDLCTQILPAPRAFRHPIGHNEVIEVQDSPLTQQRNTPPKPTRLGSARHNRSRGNLRSDAAPYQIPNARVPPKRLVLDDSQDDSSKRVSVSCPICFDSVIGKTPVSTACGHIFCKVCIYKAIEKKPSKCPMCKKAVKTGSIHQIFLGP